MGGLPWAWQVQGHRFLPDTSAATPTLGGADRRADTGLGRATPPPSCTCTRCALGRGCGPW